MGVARSAGGHAVEGRPGDGDLLGQLLVAVGRWARPRLAASPWSSGVGLARTLLAVGTAATLAATRPDVLIASPAGALPSAGCGGVNGLGLFCAVPAGHGELARWCAVAMLLAVASGWRPRLTAVPHWYVSWSLLTNGAVRDGGDQITAILTLLLVPVALTDPRRWHWQSPPAKQGGRLVAYAAILLIWLQVAVVYLQSSVAKLGVREWADGTAMFYFFRHPLFGSPPWLRPVTDAVTGSPVGVAVVTWSPLVLEFGLAVAILLRQPVRWALLALGLAFHATIALAMGLVSFDLAMSGALLLYLLPVGCQVRVPAAVARTVSRLASRPAAAAVGKRIDTARAEPAR